MSWLSIRMQPYEANLPIDSGLFVPWMAYSPPESVMAATPIGLLGAPPGITCRVVRFDLGGRRPGGLHVLALHLRLPLPLLAGPAHRHRVADRRAVPEHQVQLPLCRLDHKRAGLNLAGVAHHLAGAGGDGGAHRREGDCGEGEEGGALRHDGWSRVANRSRKAFLARRMCVGTRSSAVWLGL